MPLAIQQKIFIFISKIFIMPSLIPGFEFDIFISYRQKDNKHDGWVTEFVNQLKGELESTFKEDVSVYLDINPHDGLLESHEVGDSLKEKLKCLIFIPIISRTYCDPKSFAWEHELKAFIELAARDQFGLKVKLPNGNVTSRVLPIRIHDLDKDDIKQCESILGGFLRGIEFIYKEPGVNKPLSPLDDEKKNLNNTKYRIQINKVANAIDEIIHSLKRVSTAQGEERQQGTLAEGNKVYGSKSLNNKAKNQQKIYKWLIISLVLILCVVGAYTIFKTINSGRQETDITKLDKSIAVLPFTNDSPDKENEYFCNGMMEEILNQLQKIKDLRVKSRTSVERYRNPDIDIKEIGHELGVSLILEGSVRKAGDDLRITAQLIDAKSGNHLWSETYNGKYTEAIFEFQSNVAKKVAASLSAVITPKEEKSLDKKPTTDMRAYDLCARGQGMVDKWYDTSDSLYLRLAQNLYNRALAVDPEYLGAFSGKSRIYRLVGKYDSARICAEKIMEIDPESPDGPAELGIYYWSLNKYDSASIFLQKALDIGPNDPWAYETMGQFICLYKNDIAEGLPYYQKALDLGGGTEAWINSDLALVYCQIGEYQKALKYFNIALSLSSRCGNIFIYDYTLAVQGKYDEALHFLDSICSISACEPTCDGMRYYIYTSLKEFEKAEKYYNKALKSGDKTIADYDIYLAYLYKETGRKNKALSVLNNSIQRDEKELKGDLDGFVLKVITLRLAAAHALLDENKKALHYLSELEKTGLIEWPCTLSSFPFDKLRNDPEFKAIVRRIEDQRVAVRKKIREMEERGEIDL
jgi:TolB-like protein/Tfp pilus assembly protein PilF